MKMHSCFGAGMGVQDEGRNLGKEAKKQGNPPVLLSKKETCSTPEI